MAWRTWWQAYIHTGKEHMLCLEVAKCLDKGLRRSNGWLVCRAGTPQATRQSKPRLSLASVWLTLTLHYIGISDKSQSPLGCQVSVHPHCVATEQQDLACRCHHQLAWPQSARRKQRVHKRRCMHLSYHARMQGRAHIALHSCMDALCSALIGKDSRGTDVDRKARRMSLDLF